MKRYKFSFVFAMLIIFVCLTSACGHRKTIPERYYEDYKTSILDNSETESVRMEFRRPALEIEVRVPDAVDEEDMDQILELTKPFVTIDKMNEIADYVNWDDVIPQADLNILNSTGDTVLKEYETDYFASYDASDYSPENIDGYETWR